MGIIRKENVMATHEQEYTIESLMNEYGQRILWLAYSYVKDKSLAEDITQEVFVNCYNNLHQFRGDSSIKTWLYRIASNRCKDVMKSWAFRSKKITGSLFDDHKSEAGNPEKILIDRIESQELSNNVLALPVKYREIIYLFYFENYKIEDICLLLSLNTNTVKSRLHRGRLLLKDMYEGGGRNGK